MSEEAPVLGHRSPVALPVIGWPVALPVIGRPVALPVIGWPVALPVIGWLLRLLNAALVVG